MTDQMTERVAVVAKLRPGSRDRAAQIIAEGAPYDLGAAGFRAAPRVPRRDGRDLCFRGFGHRRACRRARRRPHSLSRPSASGGRFSKGRLRWRGRSSTGKPASAAGRLVALS